jgi:hypothetical protein
VEEEDTDEEEECGGEGMLVFCTGSGEVGLKLCSVKFMTRVRPNF